MIGVVIRDNSDKAHVNGSAHLLHWGASNCANQAACGQILRRPVVSEHHVGKWGGGGQAWCVKCLNVERERIVYARRALAARRENQVRMFVQPPPMKGRNKARITPDGRPLSEWVEDLLREKPHLLPEEVMLIMAKKGMKLSRRTVNQARRRLRLGLIEN